MQFVCLGTVVLFSVLCLEVPVSAYFVESECVLSKMLSRYRLSTK